MTGLFTVILSLSTCFPLTTQVWVKELLTEIEADMNPRELARLYATTQVAIQVTNPWQKALLRASVKAWSMQLTAQQKAEAVKCMAVAKRDIERVLASEPDWAHTTQGAEFTDANASS